MTIDLKRVSFWLSRYNSASFNRLRVSTGAHDGLMNPGCLKGQCVISQLFETICT